MQSLIIPLLIFLAVGLWGVFEHGRKFRKEFKKRGIPWDQLCADIQSRGTLIVDTLYGPQRGLGHPVIWFSREPLVQGEELREHLESRALLVKCPKALRTTEALRTRFGPDRIIVHTWSVDLSLVSDHA